MAGLHTVLLAVAAAEEYVPPDDWRGVIALPAGIIIFFGAIFLLLKSNLGTRRAYLVEASCFFGFMLILSLFWGFGAPGTPRNTGPQSLPGQPADYYTPKWVAFAGDSTLAQERFGLVQQFPEGFQEEGGGDGDAAAGGGEGAAGGGGEEAEAGAEGADDSAAGGADEIGNFFREERGGVTLIGDEWVLAGPPLVATAENGEKVVGATYAKPFAFNDDGEIPEGPNGQPLFTEDQVGQPIPEDFPVPSGLDQAVQDLVTPETFTAYAFFDPGFAFFPSLVMIVISAVGFVLHALLLGWDENREKERSVEEVVIEREPVGAGR
ncbi:MAG TPA: hypothetical protein VK923_12575 [Euzebyales bacterium]|nr:hypothetical protein [Euzebyales bacterium]